tara:strand:- start:523 stop:927 length:405 start_codon:yes stop_codon:yes gene_type:complete
MARIKYQIYNMTANAYPGWIIGHSEGPAGRTSQRVLYSVHQTLYHFLPKINRGSYCKQRGPAGYWSWGEDQEKEENPDGEDYQFMGLKKSCSEEDLRLRYREMALKLHPDKSTGDTALFQKLKQCYDNIKSLFI